MGKSLIEIAFDKFFNESRTGRFGEFLTENELKLVQLFGRKGKVLRNVYVPKADSGTSEIDLVFITQKGIFVFESKNYSGWIFGDENSQYWTVSLANGEKNKFYNPIKQNKTHIKWLGKLVGENIPLFSIIVFSERCELKKVTVDSPDVFVIKRDMTYAAVRKVWNQNEDVLNDEQIDTLYAELEKLTGVDEATKDAHIKNINDKYMRKQPEESEESMVCPKCGGKLVRRTAKSGPNTGKEFYGCSAFPKCRYVRNIDLDNK